VLVVLNVNESHALRNEYRIDNGRWLVYREPFAIAQKGVHTVVFRTLDEAGNLLAEAARMVEIDRGKAHGNGHDDDHGRDDDHDNCRK